MLHVVDVVVVIIVIGAIVFDVVGIIDAAAETSIGFLVVAFVVVAFVVGGCGGGGSVLIAVNTDTLPRILLAAILNSVGGRCKKRLDCLYALRQ